MTQDAPRDPTAVLESYADDATVVGELQRDDDAVVQEVSVDGQRAVWKRYLGDDAVANAAREVAALRLVGAETSVPVPSVLAAEGDSFLASWCGGDGYDAADERGVRVARLRAAGATLARIHDAATFEAHGRLHADGHPDASHDVAALVVDDGTAWSRLLVGRLNRWAADLGGEDAALAINLAALVRENRAAFDAEPPVLTHDAFTPEHVGFDGTAVSRVVDFETVTAAPGEVDLVRAELGWFDAPNAPEPKPDGTLRNAPREGYERVRPLDDGFRARRTVYRAALPLRFLRNAATAGGGVDTAVRHRVRSFVRQRLDDAAAAMEAA